KNTTNLFTMRDLFIVSTFIKLLLIPAYRSTDFEVHRNWLAITHSLPIDKWYIENTSEWTLDYPPFFAWFEKTLSMFAALVDPEMLKVDNLGYASTETIIFQRLSVIVSELVLYFALVRLIMLGGSVIAIFGISFGPFIYLGQLPAVFQRLFPFTRGLCHAYWAPNFWALYAGADRVFIILAKKFGWRLNEQAITSMTRGYVGDTQFAVLPTIEALHTMIITLIIQLVVLQKLWRKPTFDNFLSSLTLCAFASYLFGWHVHEKAIIIVLIPYGLMASNSRVNLRVFVILSAAGIFSLYPLLFRSTETPIKITITLLWFCAIIPGLAYSIKTPLKNLLTTIEENYLVGLLVLQLYTGFVHDLVFGQNNLQFLPLMVTSLYCSVGIVYGWSLFMINYLSG
ncbi:hypothetical protein INT46_005155, partial [Mucor plumbeus]